MSDSLRPYSFMDYFGSFIFQYFCVSVHPSDPVKNSHNNQTIRHLFQRIENLFSHRSLYKHIYNSFICNCSKTETIHCPQLAERLNRQWCIYILDYYSAVKRNKLDNCNNLDEPRGNYTEFKKLWLKVYMLHDSTYTAFMK